MHTPPAALLSGSLGMANGYSVWVAAFQPGPQIRPQVWRGGGENEGLSTSWVNALLPAYQPLQALEVLLLVQIVSQRVKDHAKAAGSSCQVTQLLLTLGCPSYAQVQVPATPACGPGFGDWLLFSEKMRHQRGSFSAFCTTFG